MNPDKDHCVQFLPVSPVASITTKTEVKIQIDGLVIQKKVDSLLVNC